MAPSRDKKLLFSITTIILTTTLSLVLISSFFIIFFNYGASYQSILGFSQETMSRVATIIDEKLKSMLGEQEQLVETGAYFFQATDDLSLSNKELTAYMLGTLKSDSAIYSYYILKGEKFIESANIASVGQTHYSTNPEKELPPETVYRLLFVDRSVHPPIEYLVYKDKSFQTIGSESTTENVFDPKVRPWYYEAQKSKGIYWTNIYTDYFSHKKGVTLGAPFFDKNGQIEGIVGIYLLIHELHDFLAEQKIGTSGHAVILDSAGNMIGPTEELPIIQKTFAQYKNEHQNQFFLDLEGTLYLASVKEFPLGKKNWLILIYVPFLDFFGKMLRTQFFIISVSYLILIVSAIIAVLLSRKISRPIVNMSEEIDKIKHLNFEIGNPSKSLIKEIDLMGSSIISMQAAIRSFSHFVPKEIVHHLILTSQEIRLYGEKKELSIFFLDIQGFTTIAENLPLEKLTALLAEYYDSLSRIILDCKGTIDKYMGDNIMAFWGAPLDEPEHSSKACFAAIKCQKFVEEFNEKQRNLLAPEFHARIGIHSGFVIVGNVGTEERMNYTVIGDPVNVASRLEGLAKVYQVNTLISEDTYEKVKEEFLARPLDFTTVRGKSQPIKILELVALKKGDPQLRATPLQIELCQFFTEAYEAFYGKRYRQAYEMFRRLESRFPDDFPTKIYLERLEKEIGKDS